MFLVISPVLWSYHPRLAPGIVVFLSATGSLLCYWHHSSESIIPVTPCLPGVCRRFCTVDCVVSCRTWCILSAGCVSVYSPLLGLWSTLMIACQIKSYLWLVFLCLCSGGGDISCKCGTLAWLVYLSGFSCMVLLIFIPVVAVGRQAIFFLVCLGLDIYKGAYGRSQIRPTQRLWHFYGSVWISFLCQTGFFSLIPWMTTPGLFFPLEVFRPGIYYQYLCVWVMRTICISCQTAWLQCILQFLWLCQRCHQCQYSGDNLSG